MSEVKEIQKKIEAAYTRAIRLEKTKKKRNETLHEFLIKFFTQWVNEKATIYVDNREIQTNTGGNHNTMRRSLGDIFMICKYYYPSVTLEEVLRELYVGLREHFSQGYRTSYCYALKKRVWYYEEERKNLEHDKTKHDEYGKPYRFYLGLFKDLEDEDEPEICPDCEELLEDCTCGNDYDEDYDDGGDGW